MSKLLASGLSARRSLQDEGVEVIAERHPRRWETRPLRIALLNLMPHKIETETQIARLLGTTPFQVELAPVRRLAYRDSDGSGGLLVDRLPLGAPAAGLARQPDRAARIAAIA